VAGVILARMGSTRFPNKILSLINGKTILELIIDRVKQCKACEIEIVLATTKDHSDDSLSSYAKNLGIEVFRGETTDVLSRAINAGKSVGGTHLLRLNGDCPLVEPELIDEALISLITKRFEVISSKGQNGIPYGVSVEIAELNLLNSLSLDATVHEKEHIFSAVYSNIESFRHLKIGEGYPSRQDLRLTVDFLGDNLRIGQMISAAEIAAINIKYWEIPIQHSSTVE
jgi:spore coat polysaccharide biosynthesis protein SpsF